MSPGNHTSGAIVLLGTVPWALVALPLPAADPQQPPEPPVCALASARNLITGETMATGGPLTVKAYAPMLLEVAPGP